MHTEKEKEKPFQPNAPRKPDSSTDVKASKDRPPLGVPDKSSTKC